jgi:phosphate acetyltransferase
LGVVKNELVKTLNAQVILVAARADKTIGQLDDQIEYAANAFGGLEKIIGAIINRYPVDKSEFAKSLVDDLRSQSRLFSRRQLELVGVVPDSPELTFCRTIDIQRELNAEVMNAGEMVSRRVKTTHLLARTVPNLLYTFAPGAIMLTPADRSDVILAVGMAALSHIPIAGLILTGDSEPDERIIRFCKPALETGLPLLRVRTDSYTTATRLYQRSTAVPADDIQRIEDAIEHVAQTLDIDWLISQSEKELEFRLSPAAFLHRLTARRAPRKTDHPTGRRSRARAAAIALARDGHAACCLATRRSQAVARSQDIERLTTWKLNRWRCGQDMSTHSLSYENSVSRWRWPRANLRTRGARNDDALFR